MTTIEQKVMAGVGLIYIGRKLASPLAFQWYALILSAVGIAMFVSLPNVVQNFQAVAAAGGLPSITNFVLSAVTSTTVIVQLWLVLGVVAVLSLFVRAALSFTPRGITTA